MKDTYQLNHWIKTHADIALDLLRIYLGIGLMLKAIYFMGHSEYMLQLMDNADSLWFAPAVVMHYVVLAHFCGGLLLALGMFTRVAAMVQLPVLSFAIFSVHMPQMLASVEARQSVEFAGLVFFLLALYSIYGAGRLSVDYAWARKQHPDLFETGTHVAKPA